MSLELNFCMLCVIDDGIELYLFASIQNVDIKFSPKEMCTPISYQNAFKTTTGQKFQYFPGQCMSSSLFACDDQYKPSSQCHSGIRVHTSTRC